MSEDKLPLSFSRETLDEVKALLRGADPDAPLVDRLRNPRTPYSPALLREEAAARIEELEAKLAKAVEGLMKIKSTYYREAANPSPETIRRMAACMNGIARDTIAEINGGDNE